ncbi:aa3-type cytochrome c oxidase subunit IV [Oricola thermophila]|uniref:Aa3-type cytochrome c oxidase subunit IV n=1 Tax=Oricola thermophila TaxID=2742145 RepID=A0A6N1VKN7_9HYPH|nr:aa3-type cytochrome c oxidase subunit IV [Oricola thermophila]QKV20345.1 aa3-type cytochrome c oxidase subunit IV [Oricola thermophila]
MAENQPTGPAETGAEMDYGEHERTFSMFLALTKWLVILSVSLLVAMAFGFFAGGGLFGGIVLFIVLNALAYFLT